MNGREQVEHYSKLWQPDELAGFHVGDLVDVHGGLGRCEVIGLIPPSLLRIRTKTGAEAKAGIYACQRVVA